MSTDESVRPAAPSGPDPAAPAADASDGVIPTPRRRGGARRKTKRDDAAAAPVLPEGDEGDESDGGNDGDDGSGGAEPDLRFWHRAHPVFTPLAGFFTGVVAILIVLAALGWLLDEVFEYDVTQHPWVFLVAIGAVFLVNLVLVGLPGARRFARYMLFGVLATPVVVGGVAALTFYVLVKNDG